MKTKKRKILISIILTFALLGTTAGACENDCKSPVGVGSDAYCNSGTVTE